jgi:hypothetical protein
MMSLRITASRLAQIVASVGLGMGVSLLANCGPGVPGGDGGTEGTGEGTGGPDFCPIDVGPMMCPDAETDYCECIALECPNDPSFHQIWTSASCTNCHAPDDVGNAPAAELDLRPSEAFLNLVGRNSVQSSLNRVEPGQLVESYLWHKLRRTHLCPAASGEGDGMPPSSIIAEDDLLAIETWICCGAQF